MRKTILALAIATLVGLAQDASAQGIGVALRAGTVGIGGEGAVALSERLVVRGGLGLMPLELTVDYEDIDWDLELPDTWYNIGIDFYPAGSFRIGGGILFKSDGPTLTATPTQAEEIGDMIFTPQELGTLNASLVSGDKAPYAIIGFGRHTDLGFGLFVDLGVALLGDPEIDLDVTGSSYPDQAELRRQLDIEARNLEDEAGTFLSFWPFLSVGVRFGIS